MSRCFFQKMSENSGNCGPRLRLERSYFFPWLKNIPFTVTEKVRNPKIFTFKRLESENLDFFCLQENQTR